MARAAGRGGVNVSDNYNLVCEDCMSRVGEAKWRKRAVTAELELRKCYKDVEQLTAERNDLQAQVSDAGIRNAVLEKRLERLLHEIEDSRCPTAPPAVGCIPDVHEPCYDCWREWLEQEVQA